YNNPVNNPLRYYVYAASTQELTSAGITNGMIDNSTALQATGACNYGPGVNARQASVAAMEISATQSIGQVYPNPAQELAFIPYMVDEQSLNSVIVIRDLALGREL